MNDSHRLDAYTDDELWDLVEYPVDEDMRARYQELFRLDAREDLTPAERDELDALSDEVDYRMGQRELALDLLAARGYDVSGYNE